MRKAASGEFGYVGADGKVRDLRMHAEILQEDDLLEAATRERMRLLGSKRKWWKRTKIEIQQRRRARSS